MSRHSLIAGNGPDRRHKWLRIRGQRWSKLCCAAPAVFVVAICCGVPLLWLLLTVIANPSVLADLSLTTFRAGLLARTLAYNLAVAVLATVLALPMAFVIGRGRGWGAKLLRGVMPAVLFMPFLSFEYGWLQCIRILQPVYRPMGLSFEPAGVADILRCIWILAAWLWVVPAYLIGMSLRQLDPTIQECALLDGVPIRMTLRQLYGPIAASVAVVTILATQEFAVYEPTGVNVVATEVRMVFSTGAFSSLPDRSHQGSSAPLTQSERAAAAVATAAPLLLTTLLLAGLALGTARRLSIQESLHVGDWSPRLDAPRWILWLALITMLICVGCPIFSLCASMRSIPTQTHLLSDLARPALGSMAICGVVVLVTLVVAASAVCVRSRWLVPIAVLSFLIGGELLAISLIRLCNRPLLEWARDSCVLPSAVYLGRFGWIALVVASGTWARGWRELRLVAALDGAGPARIAAYIIWPLAWPMLLAGSLLVGALSLTEVTATATLIPEHPPVLTTALLAWAHKNRFEPMIEASLLSVGAVTILGIGLSALLSLVARRSRAVERQTAP